MHIDNYKSGHIIINGAEYEFDVLVYPEDDTVIKWERSESSEVNEDDLEDIDIVSPDVLVIGTGRSKSLKILHQTRQLLNELGIELIAIKTKEAVKVFNMLLNKKEKRIIGAFHLV